MWQMLAGVHSWDAEDRLVDTTQFFTALGAIAGVASLIVGIIALRRQGASRAESHSTTSTPQANAPARQPAGPRPVPTRQKTPSSAPTRNRLLMTIPGAALVIAGLGVVSILFVYGQTNGLGGPNTPSPTSTAHSGPSPTALFYSHPVENGAAQHCMQFDAGPSRNVSFYDWTFDYKYEVQGNDIGTTSPTVNHSYFSAGVYKARLRTSDDSGAAEDIETITVP